MTIGRRYKPQPAALGRGADRSDQRRFDAGNQGGALWDDDLPLLLSYLGTTVQACPTALAPVRTRRQTIFSAAAGRLLRPFFRTESSGDIVLLDASATHTVRRVDI